MALTGEEGLAIGSLGSSVATDMASAEERRFDVDEVG